MSEKELEGEVANLKERIKVLEVGTNQAANREHILAFLRQSRVSLEAWENNLRLTE